MGHLEEAGQGQSPAGLRAEGHGPTFVPEEGRTPETDRSALVHGGFFRFAASASSLIQKTAAEQTIRIIETLDYRTEMRSRSTEPETVYLLEQVSDSTPRGIKY
jgi:hypothetical protein